MTPGHYSTGVIIRRYTGEGWVKRIFFMSDTSTSIDTPCIFQGGGEFEFIGVLRHMRRYFSHVCDGTDV